MAKAMISICVTTYNRPDITLCSFRQVFDHPLISEIVIVDDYSDVQLFSKLLNNMRSFTEKVKLYRNPTNLDCYRNKREAISRATNDVVIILDSDNVIDNSYIEAIRPYLANYDPSVILAPEFARPNFDYRKYSGQVFDRYNCGHFVAEKEFHWLINTMNYCVHRDTYLQYWQEDIDPHTADTALQNYNMIVNGCSLLVVPGMQYDHLVHSGSHYKQNVHKTGNLFNELMERFKLMI